MIKHTTLGDNLVGKALNSRNSTNIPEKTYLRKILADLRSGDLKEVLDRWMAGDELAGKKSERTTFSLSQEAISHLDNLLEVSETKIKDLIDHLIKDFAVKNLTGEKNDWGDIEEISNQLTKLSKAKKIRKTYVISSGSLNLLNMLSKILKIERNIIMENIIVIYVNFRERLIEKKYGKYEKTILLLQEIAVDAEEKLEQLKKALNLNDNDPLTDAIDAAIFDIYNQYNNLMELIDNPQKIIEWEETQKRTKINIIFKEVV
jgi:hypothetical protein